MVAPHRTTRGFTLIELLVVLAILGSLTLVAVRSLQPLEQRSRFDATVRVLSDVERAILGEPGSANAASRTGYVADLGALPTSLDQLVQNPGVAPSHLAVDAVDTDVRLATGWRGPYLWLPPGGETIDDGWGNPLTLLADGTAWTFGSLGAEGMPGGEDFDADITISLRNSDPTVAVERVKSEVAGTVTVEADSSFQPGNWRVTVFAYAPDPVTGELLAIASDPLQLSASAPFTASFAFAGDSSLTIGPRALRAYLHLSADEPRQPGGRRSPVLHRTLQPGAQTIDLTIPEAP